MANGHIAGQTMLLVIAYTACTGLNFMCVCVCTRRPLIATLLWCGGGGGHYVKLDADGMIGYTPTMR